MNNTMDLSIVIPVYNEAENLEPLLEELTGILNQLDKTSEIICVNDASTDDSLGILNRLAAKFPQLRILTHGINSGESAGQATGFRSAAGDVIITMDADMQNDPGDIPRLLKALTGEVACVCGVRKIREDDAVRRVSSYIANKFRNFITGDAVSDAGCTFRAIRRPVLREMIVFNGMHRFLSTILRAQCYRVVEIPTQPPRPSCRPIKVRGSGTDCGGAILDCFAMRWYKARAVNGNRLETNQAVDGSLL